MDGESEEPLTKQLTFRVSESDVDRLQEVSGPVAKSLVARAAFRLGLQVFEQDPTKVLDIKPAPRGPKPRKAD